MLKTELETEPQDELDTQPTGVLVRYPDGTRFALQMPGERATVGSGAGCAIPIRYQGVAPLHCVLFSTSTGWRIRRWSTETKLNGETFTESPVEAGDRLQVGPVDIDFLGEPLPVVREERYDAEGEEVAPEINFARGPSWEEVESLVGEAISKQSEELEQLRGRLSTSSNLVEESLGECRDRLSEYAEQLASAEQARASFLEDLAGQSRQLEELRTLVESQFDGFEKSETFRREIVDRLAEIDENLGQLEERQAAIPETLAEQERRLDEIRMQGEANSIRHEQSESAFCGLQDQIAELRQRFASGKLLETDIAESLNELSQQLAGLRDRVEEATSWKQEWEGAHQHLNNQIIELQQGLKVVDDFQSVLPELRSEMYRGLDDLGSQIGGISEQQAQTDVVASEIREGLEEIRRELTSRGEEFSTFHETTSGHTRQLTDLQEQVAAIASRIEKSDESLNGLQETFEGLIEQSNRDQSMRDDDRDALAILNREFQSIREEFANVLVDRPQAENDLNELRREIHVVRDALASREQVWACEADWREELNGGLESLQSQMEAVSSRHEQYGASLSELRGRLDVSNDSAAEAKQSFQLVQEALAQQRQDVEGLREQIGSAPIAAPDPELQSELESLREELHALRLDRARDEQLHLATRDAVVELERQIAERPTHDGNTKAATVSDGCSMESALVAESTCTELFASTKETYQEPESFLNKYQHLLDEDEKDILKPTEASHATSVGAQAIQQESKDGSKGEDASIEDYMSQLLERVRGESSVIASKSPSKPKVEQVATSTVQPSKPAIKPVSDLQEIKSTPAPERSRDMAALRDLANSSARNSLHEAKVRKSREYAVVKLFVSIFAIVCGYIVIGLSPSYTSPEFIGGLVPVIAGVIWGGNTIVIIIQAIRTGSFAHLDPAEEAPPEIPADLSADEL